MNSKIYCVLLLMLLTFVSLDCKRLSKSRGSGTGRNTSRKTNYNPQPAPTQHSQSAAQPSLFGWQEKTAQRSQATGSRQNKPPSETHSYPSSQTGLSGSAPKNHDNIQKTNAYPQNSGRNGQQASAPTSNNQQSHGYPASGSSGSGVSYPSQQGGGLSGNAPKQPPTNQKSNAYPQNNQQSNLNQQSHGYPATNGLSGNSGTGVGYPSHQGAPPPYSGNPASGGYHGANNYGNNYHHQGPPPPYPGNFGQGSGGYGGYNAGYGGHNMGYGSQMPGYFGNYGNKGFGGMSRSSSALTGVGIAGAGVGTILTGLALWNLARSTGHRQHTVIYDNRGQPVAVASADNSSTTGDSILGDLVNCTLTISNGNATEVLGIPCSIATSFTPEADVKDQSGLDNNANDSTTCTVTVVTKAGKEFMTTIPCSLLLNTAAANNVTEAPLIANGTNEFDFKNETYPVPPVITEQPSALTLDVKNTTDSINNMMNCTSTEEGAIRDPINPCFAVTYDLTVQPLQQNLDNDTVSLTQSPNL